MKALYEQIEKIIMFIGTMIFLIGFFVSFRFTWLAIDYDDIDSFLIGVTIVAGCFVLALLMFGFSAIIEKLKENTKNQAEIIKLLKKYDKENS